MYEVDNNEDSNKNIKGQKSAMGIILNYRKKSQKKQ